MHGKVTNKKEKNQRPEWLHWGVDNIGFFFIDAQQNSVTWQDILLLGTESLHPSKILLVKPVTQRDGIYRRGLWEVIQVRGGHDGRSGSDGVSALIITF